MSEFAVVVVVVVVGVVVVVVVVAHAALLNQPDVTGLEAHQTHQTEKAFRPSSCH